MSARSITAVGLWGLALALTVVFAPMAQAQSNYQIRPGDTLRVEVLEDAALNRNVLVLPDGSISFPLVGTIPASGRSVAQLRQSLASGLTPNFANEPNVFVSVATLAERRAATPRTPLPDPVIDAFIMGEVAKPGKLEVSPGTTILQLLAQAGGLTKFAADKRIELRRTDPETGAVSIYLFSYTGRGRGTRIPGSTSLIEGDVVVVPERRLFE